MAGVAERVMENTYAPAFEAVQRESATGPAWLRPIREAAFARFADRGLPTTRDEEWKFTSLSPMASLQFQRAGADAGVTLRALEPLLFNAAAPHQIVVVNGRLSPALSSLAGLPAGVRVSRLADATDALSSRLTATGEPFVTLNTALLEDAVIIDVAAGTVMADPLHVLFVATTGPAPVVVAPRVFVRAGDHAQISILESYATLGTGVALTTAVVDIVAEPGSIVDHVKVHRESARAFHFASIFADLQRGSTLTSHAFTFGGRISRNDIVAALNGEGAECTLNGLYIADGESLADTHTTIDHTQPHCPSHEVYKGILTDRARAVFNGKIVVRPQAQKTNAKQTNKALLLSDTAQVNAKPQLEIFADDVKCTHGAAIGQIDEDALFYLRARGIGVFDARNMMIHAFAGDVLAGVKSPDVRARIERAMEEKLRLPHVSTE